MKTFRSLLLIAAGVAVLITACFVLAGDKAQAADDRQFYVWDEQTAEAFVCDTTTFRKLLDDNAKSRMCVVKAVAQSEPARELVVTKLLSYAAMRERIMDRIAADPELRQKMEEKLAATEKK